MATTKTSSAVKRRYNNKVYSPVTVYLSKDLVAQFKERCVRTGKSQASVVREAVERFLSETEEK